MQAALGLYAQEYLNLPTKNFFAGADSVEIFLAQGISCSLNATCVHRFCLLALTKECLLYRWAGIVGIVGGEVANIVGESTLSLVSLLSPFARQQDCA